MKRSKAAVLTAVLLGLGCTAGALPAGAAFADTEGDVPSGASYTIMSRLSGKYMTAGEDGNVLQWEQQAGDSQIWQIISTNREKNLCKILSADGRALTVEGGDETNGNNIALAPYEDTPAQHFILHRTDDAYYITAECSGNAALDVYDISYDNGANIDQWDYWKGEGQKWYIRPADNTYTFVRGDLDRDGVVDTFDRALLQRGLLGSLDRADEAIADLNGDGHATVSDLVTLTKFLHGKDVTIDQNCTLPCDEPETAYLFAYFLGNAPEQERLSYAVSLDGYHFTALNSGKAVWNSSVGTKCLRDPYIFKGEDGLYHLLATDMKSSLGWNSNRDILTAKSTDLIHWFDETSIKIANASPLMMGADRAWAPQAIYDPEQKSYMIYFAARVPGRDDRTIMYYAYSKDLKKLDTEPKLLFAPQNGNDAIDSDIIFQNGTYYMYYKNETNKRLYLAKSGHASGPWQEMPQISPQGIGVEGPNIYRILGTDKWVMMSDAYGDGYYVMQETTDLENFTTVPRSGYSFDFTPRHGYVIPITDDQYDALIHAFPSPGATVKSTGTDAVTMYVSQDETFSMPETVGVNYTGGMTVQAPVTWDAADVAAINQTRPGVYTVSGTVRRTEDTYTSPFIRERADPYIVSDGNGWYYFTASYPAYGSADKGYDRIVLRRSRTVAGLADAEEQVIWKAHSSGILSRHIWAPEMHYIGGSWYIFFAAGASDNVWAIRPYVLQCDGEPCTGKWTELGQMQASAGDTESFAGFSLDMTYFENKGKHYVIWAEIKGDSSLFMAEIDPAAPNKLISKPILLTKPEYSWELVNHRVNEGPAVLKANDRVYVFFSASGTGSEYCVGRLEAYDFDDLMDPKSWTKLDHPVLCTGNLLGESGPGHNCFVRDENGDLLIVYHARPAEHAYQACGTYNKDPLYDPCRHTHIGRVLFDAESQPVINLSPLAELADSHVTATVIVN